MKKKSLEATGFEKYRKKARREQAESRLDWNAASHPLYAALV
jgi:hypothetical protein